MKSVESGPYRRIDRETIEPGDMVPVCSVPVGAVFELDGVQYRREWTHTRSFWNKELKKRDWSWFNARNIETGEYHWLIDTRETVIVELPA